MKKKIIVIKIGSSVLMTKRKKLDEFRISHIAQQLISLQQKGIGVVLVVSGAVVSGINLLENYFNNMPYGNDRLHLGYGNLDRQIAAGIGQVQLITFFQKIFWQRHLIVAQILLNKDDLRINKRSIRNIIRFYINNEIIPIFNENDVVSLNSFGGNDFLAGEIAQLLSADKLLILSSYQTSAFSIGGGRAKEAVSRTLAAQNIKTIITDGKAKNIILTSIK